MQHSEFLITAGQDDSCAWHCVQTGIHEAVCKHLQTMHAESRQIHESAIASSTQWCFAPAPLHDVMHAQQACNKPRSRRAKSRPRHVS